MSNALGTYTATLYARPNGRAAEHEITHIYKDDADWFRANNAKLSIEDDGSGGYIAYADLGLTEEDDETPREAVAFSAGRNCQDTLRTLRGYAERMLANTQKEQAA